MNTGIGDAVNLAWKLAAVIQGRASTNLLESYELERLPFARSLVATTDRVFEAVVGLALLAILAGRPISAQEITARPTAPPRAAQVLVDEAVAKAAVENKGVLVKFGASWCGWQRFSPACGI